MRWSNEDLRRQLGVPVGEGVTATESEDERARPVLHLSDGRTARRHPAWPYQQGVPQWIVESADDCPSPACAVSDTCLQVCR